MVPTADAPVRNLPASTQPCTSGSFAASESVPKSIHGIGTSTAVRGGAPVSRRGLPRDDSHQIKSNRKERHAAAQVDPCRQCEVGGRRRTIEDGVEERPPVLPERAAQQLQQHTQQQAADKEEAVLGFLHEAARVRWGAAAEGRSATHHIGRGLRKEGLPARTPRHRAARSSAHARRCRAAAAARLACGVLLVRPLARARAQAARPGARAAVGREGVSGGSRRTDWPRLQGAAQERRGSGVFSSRRHVGRALYQSCHLIRCRPRAPCRTACASSQRPPVPKKLRIEMVSD